MKKIILIALSVFLFHLSNAQVLAPDFTVVDTDGNSHNLYDYCEDGKIVVLDFFYVGCSYCEYYSVHIQQSYEDFGCNNGDVVFLAIDWNDTDAEVQTFDSTYSLTYPSASGLEGGGDSVVSLYNISYFTTLLVIGPNKQILKNIKPPTTNNIDSFLLVLGAQMTPCNVSIEEEVKESNVQLIQNPIQQDAKIFLHVTKSANYQICISDLSGKVVYQNEYRLEVGRQELSLTSALSKGVYLLHLVNNNQAINFKLIVQ